MLNAKARQHYKLSEDGLPPYGVFYWIGWVYPPAGIDADFNAWQAVEDFYAAWEINEDHDHHKSIVEARWVSVEKALTTSKFLTVERKQLLSAAIQVFDFYYHSQLESEFTT